MTITTTNKKKTAATMTITTTNKKKTAATMTITTMIMMQDALVNQEY
jgi:hypothetical protein